MVVDMIIGVTSPCLMTSSGLSKGRKGREARGEGSPYVSLSYYWETNHSQKPLGWGGLFCDMSLATAKPTSMAEEG